MKGNKMKIVINNCHGGFGLSDKAFKMLLNKKEIEWERLDGDLWISHYYIKGHLNEDDYYISQYNFYDNRTDSDLIEVIETLGDDANNSFSDLKIIEIPDDIEYTIEEYDGKEWVAEKHRTWC